MASRVRGSSPAACMRLKSSRHETPASTRMRVRVLETTVLLPREPLASTVIRTMKMRIRPMRVEDEAETRAGVSIQLRVFHSRTPAVEPFRSAGAAVAKARSHDGQPDCPLKITGGKKCFEFAD